MDNNMETVPYGCHRFGPTVVERVLKNIKELVSPLQVYHIYREYYNKVKDTEPWNTELVFSRRGYLLEEFYAKLKTRITSIWGENYDVDKFEKMETALDDFKTFFIQFVREYLSDGEKVGKEYKKAVDMKQEVEMVISFHDHSFDLEASSTAYTVFHVIFTAGFVTRKESKQEKTINGLQKALNDATMARESELQDWKKKSTEMDHAAKLNETKIKQLQLKLVESSAKKTALQKKLEESKEKNEALQKKLDESKEKNEALQKKVKRYKRKYRRRIIAVSDDDDDDVIEIYQSQPPAKKKRKMPAEIKQTKATLSKKATKKHTTK